VDSKTEEKVGEAKEKRGRDLVLNDPSTTLSDFTFRLQSRSERKRKGEKGHKKRRVQGGKYPCPPPFTLWAS